MEAIPINQSEQKGLEKYFVIKFCPFTGEERVPRLSGYTPSSAFYLHYICAVDGGKARGGQNQGLSRDSGPEHTPCSLNYAKTCPLYQNQMEEFGIK